MPQQISGIDRLASQCGWLLRTASIDAPPQDWNGDGVLVVLADNPVVVDYVRKIRERGIPVVDLVEERIDVDVPRVTGDDMEIGRLAAEHFNDRDFRHAAFFSFWSLGPCHDLRFAGFQNAWKGMPPDSWLWPDEVGGDDADLVKMRNWLVGKLEAAPKPLAVFAWNDYDAAYVLSACRMAKLKVPDEVAVLGVDNNVAVCERQYVKTSSVAHNLKRIGYVGAAMLERLMSGKELSQRFVRIAPQGIVTRESTGLVNDREQIFRAVIAYIDEHLSSAFGAAEIAAALNVPRKRLDRLVSARLGHSIGTEIANRRLARAKQLLATTDLRVEHVSAQCGYCNTSFFIRSFRKAVGKTPLAWRKEMSE